MFLQLDETMIATWHFLQLPETTIVLSQEMTAQVFRKFRRNESVPSNVFDQFFFNFVNVSRLILCTLFKTRQHNVLCFICSFRLFCELPTFIGKYASSKPTGSAIPLLKLTLRQFSWSFLFSNPEPVGTGQTNISPAKNPMLLLEHLSSCEYTRTVLALLMLPSPGSSFSLNYGPAIKTSRVISVKLNIWNKQFVRG